MTKGEFDAKLKSSVSTSKINVKLLSDWFETILEVLSTLSTQKSAMDHPGHRGEAREVLLKEHLESMLPESLGVTKGFAVDRLLSVSKEQDLMIVNRDSAMSLIPREQYFPIHSCLASIQVKSQLTISELRKSILNCISIKKLLGGDDPLKTLEEERIGQYCYAILAYSSRKTLERIANDLNEALSGVPHYLRPNIVYVLGKGMLIPSESKAIRLEVDQIFSAADFRPVPSMGAPPSIPVTEAHAFLWFITNIIDHCLKERKLRPDFIFREYWETTLALQAAVNRIRP